MSGVLRSEYLVINELVIFGIHWREEGIHVCQVSRMLHSIFLCISGRQVLANACLGVNCIAAADS